MEGFDLGGTTLGLSLLAGLLTTLSPCVLPILPMVAASATGRSRWGLPAMAGGLALAFTAVGVTLARSGELLGLDERSLRLLAGSLMLLLGMALLSSRLQERFSTALAGIGSLGGTALARVRSEHPLAQFGVGALLGLAWSPCVGPTLGAAIALAATGQSSGEAALVMAVFSSGAVLPLIAAGLLSRSAFARLRERAQRSAGWGRWLMGASLLVVGALVVSGFDKQLEAWLLDGGPTWLSELTVKF
jgi:cytochrome c-type biogenesis protein